MRQLYFTDDPTVPRLEQRCGYCHCGLGRIEPDSLTQPIEFCSSAHARRWDAEIGAPARALAVLEAIQRAYA